MRISPAYHQKSPFSEVSEKLEKSKVGRHVVHAFKEAWNSAKSGWEKVRNPIDPDWRKNQKYHHVLKGMHEGFLEILGSEESLVYKKTVLDTLQLWKMDISKRKGIPLHHPKCIKGSKEECVYYVKKALQCLMDDRVPFSNQRERYKACLNACEKALATDHYQNLIAGDLRKIEAGHPEVAALHALAFAEFTKVNAQGFTESLAIAMAKKGGYREQFQHAFPQDGSADEKQKWLFGNFDSSAREMPAFTKAVERAASYHKIAPHTTLGTAINASNRYSRFYPIKNAGNPVNVKYALRVGDRQVTCIRSPTVTVGPDEVSPLFKAYLRALKSRGLKHTYINLQDRRKPHQHQGFRRVVQNMGFIREDLRTRTIEKLNHDPEFRNVIAVFTLDKDSDFYHQRSDNRQDRNAFLREFKLRLWDPHGSFHLPKEHREGLEKIIDSVGNLCFGERLKREERQDLIEMAYEFMADYLINATEADFFFENCKENADRGAGTNCLKLSTKLLTEILTNPDRPHLNRDIGHLVSKMNEDSLWARKRGVNERLSRSVQAIERMGQLAATKPETFLQLVRMSNAGATDVEVILQVREDQKIKHFHEDYRKMEAVIKRKMGGARWATRG